MKLPVILFCASFYHCVLANDNLEFSTSLEDNISNFLTNVMDENVADSLSEASPNSKDLMDGVAEQVLNKTLIKIAPTLANLTMENFTVNSGEQEFGIFIIKLHNITMSGLDGIIGEVISINVPPPTPLEIKNLTLYIPEVNLTAEDYTLDGHIIFPIGNNLLPLSGSNGTFQVGMTDLRLSFDIVMSKNGSGLNVDHLVMMASATSLTFFAENMMGSPDVGWAFNTVLNDVGLVIFDYFKEPLIDYYLDTFKKAIEQGVCQLLPIIC